VSADVTPLPVPRAPILAEDINAPLWNALKQHATKSAGAQDGREAKEYADAAFMIAQTITLLDPQRLSPHGVDADTYRQAMGQTLEAQVTPDSGKKAKPQQPGS
jgi:hypothetical protein